jgi:hypothetical protein
VVAGDSHAWDRRGTFWWSPLEGKGRPIDVGGYGVLRGRGDRLISAATGWGTRLGQAWYFGLGGRMGCFAIS